MLLEYVVRDPSRTVAGTQTAGGSGWRGVVVADWAWTILTGLVAAVVYTLGAKAFTDGTWGGSLAQYATAFATGFAGEAVAWRRFPIFRGRHNDVEGDGPKPPPSAQHEPQVPPSEPQPAPPAPLP